MDDPRPSSPISSPTPAVPIHFNDRPYLKVFNGPGGLRAGWRLLTFLAILFALFAIETEASRLLRLHRPQRPATAARALTPEALLLTEAKSFVLVLLASTIMAKFEGRTVADYGLPVRRAFSGQFWQGTAIGFAGISALLAAMCAAGAFRFESVALHGPPILKYAVLWGIAFLFVGLFEEFGFRGYALFTLTTGVGFWPASLISSLLFGYVHHGNHGETWLGAFNAGLIGSLFCLMLRRTGGLWLPIGFHAAWDWGESYFYGVPDSGELAAGHLLNVSFSGPRWITGGTVGPEGSWLCTFLLVILWFVFLVWLRDAKYPNPDAVVAEPPELAYPSGN